MASTCEQALFDVMHIPPNLRLQLTVHCKNRLQFNILSYVSSPDVLISESPDSYSVKDIFPHQEVSSRSDYRTWVVMNTAPSHPGHNDRGHHITHPSPFKV